MTRAPRREMVGEITGASWPGAGDHLPSSRAEACSGDSACLGGLAAVSEIMSIFSLRA